MKTGIRQLLIVALAVGAGIIGRDISETILAIGLTLAAIAVYRIAARHARLDEEERRHAGNIEKNS